MVSWNRCYCDHSLALEQLGVLALLPSIPPPSVQVLSAQVSVWRSEVQEHGFSVWLLKHYAQYP